MVFPSIWLVGLQSMVISTGGIWTCQATWGWFLSFGTTSWCTKTWGDPPLDCMYIYISLHNVNIVWLPDANSSGTKNLKGVDSLGFPGSAWCHATCTMSSINRVFVCEFLRVNKQT